VDKKRKFRRNGDKSEKRDLLFKEDGQDKTRKYSSNDIALHV